MDVRRGPLVVGLVTLALVASACHLPNLKEEEAKAPALPQTSFLYAADGTLITALHAGENRVVVPSSGIPEAARDAVVAVEDKRFYEHKGIDLKALLRAAYVDATSGRIVEGGSTITQQYVKNVYVGGEQTLSRKIREAYLAWQLEQEFTKDQILTKYLNTVYFGDGAYGIQAAAQTFFDRSASELSLAQSALLAGLVSAPVDYDPVTHPRRAISRRNLVLSQMLEQGMIGLSAYRRASARPLRLHLAPEEATRYAAPYFVDYFERWFLSNPAFGETQQERYNLLFEGGLRIVTTLEPRLQDYAEQAVNSILTYPTDPYAAMTAIDPRTGYVRAMVGGRDWWSEDDRFARVNLATGGSTGRQAGSSFKPFALVAALENGISPDKVYAAPGSIQIPLEGGQVWDVQNYDGSSSGYLSVESATVNSVNTVYAQIIMDVGPQTVIDVAKKMGIRCCRRTTEPKTELNPYPSAVLGTNEVNTLEMASALGTLATGGYHVQPVPAIEITGPNGEVLYQAETKKRQVVEPAVASVADGILQEVVQYGTGTAANIGRPQIGKTGTGQEWRDAWFLGAIPQLTAAVWVGFPQGQVSMTYPTVRITHVLGGTWPAQIWHAFMVNATAHMPVREFPSPQVEYVTVRVDVTQGCLANPYTLPSNVRYLQFIVGTEPTKVCKEPSSYQMLTVPSVIGLQEGAASGTLHSVGFNVDVVYRSSNEEPGTVIAQDPAAGEQLLQASTVTITVVRAKPSPSPTPSPVAVPDVVGLSEDEATATLVGAGFDVAVVMDKECNPQAPPCDYRKGVVWQQAPAAGTAAQGGDTVTIYVNP